jgi:hypothetical protein
LAKIKLNSSLALFTTDASKAVTNSKNRKLIISAHGGWNPKDGMVVRASYPGVTIQFYSDDDHTVSGTVEDAILNRIQTINPQITNATVKNFKLSRFEDDPKGSDLGPKLNNEYDVLKVRSKVFGKRYVHLEDVLKLLKTKSYQYPTICGLFCLYTGKDLSMEARPRTQGESDKMEYIDNVGAVTRELASKLNNSKG